MAEHPLLDELALLLNPAGVKPSRRLHCGNLSHLPRETCAAEARLAADLEAQSSGNLCRNAESAGMAGDVAQLEV